MQRIIKVNRMFKFLKSLFSEHQNKFPAPETPKPNVIPHGQGIVSGTYSPSVTGLNYTKKLPKRDSNGRFSK